MFYTILIQAANPKSQSAINKMISEQDPYGIGMTAIGMGVVFLSLLLLYLAFANVTRLLTYNIKRKQMKKSEAEAVTKEAELTGEINAAIAMALNLYLQEMHDEESTVLTINKVARSYSPWSSKIYGLRQIPR